MTKRILFGLVMIAGVSALLALDWWLQVHGKVNVWNPRVGHAVQIVGIPSMLVLLLLAFKAFTEMERLTGAASAPLLPISGLAGTLVLAMWPFWTQVIALPQEVGRVMVLPGLAAMLVFGEQMARRDRADALRRIAATLLTITYLGFGTGLILQIRMAFGVHGLALFLIVVKVTDIAAFFTGSAIGRHKLIPSISPGKSWEGLVGGVAGAVGASLLAVGLLGRAQGGEAIARIPLVEAVVFGAAVALAGQFADLCESLLKRSANVKDSGAVVPEFGGVLDIMDSPLLSSPVAILLLAVFVR